MKRGEVERKDRYQIRQYDEDGHLWYVQDTILGYSEYPTSKKLAERQAAHMNDQDRRGLR